MITVGVNSLKDTIFVIAAEKCKSCGFCVASCPRKLFSLGTTINSHGYHVAEIKDPDSCIRCRACSTMCPESAIEIMIGEE